MADSGLVIAAPHSGAGKTLVTLGLARALADSGLVLAPAKTGPDYIDPAYIARAAGAPCVNLDPWAMPPDALRGLAASHSGNADMLLVEGVMGLFDGAAGGGGATADCAAALGLPVVLVVDCSRMAQSVAALVSGFARFRDDVHLAGVILNKVASARHETMLRDALAPAGIPVLGTLHRATTLRVPSRHLGLTLPGEIADADRMIAEAAKAIAAAIDLDSVKAAAQPPLTGATPKHLPPLGQRIAIARDAAFAFIYEHFLASWYAAGAELSFFSPLAGEAPAADADAIFLPGGYPELHGPVLAAAGTFRAGLEAARDAGALIYGECGGYMVLGRSLTDAEGHTHEMAGLLPLDSHIDRPRRVLGYRRLTHTTALPWPATLAGHEFHYSSGAATGLSPLFTATDATGAELPVMGAADGRVMGSYAHVIAELVR